MQFIADSMLGRLARWLRLAGFDTLYYPDIDDGELMKVASRDGRLILTRDTRLAGRCGTRCLVVESDHVLEQLRQVLGDLGLTPSPVGRCANCNGELVEVSSKEDVRDLVPEHVYRSQSRFRRCAVCGKLYWEGSHHSRFMRGLASAGHGQGGRS